MIKCALKPREDKSSVGFRGHLITNFPSSHGITYNYLRNNVLR